MPEKQTEVPQAVAIIAGGLSKRFGRPKARALLEGREFIDWALTLARRLSSRVFIVHTEVDDFADKSVPGVPDKVPRCGPMGGVYTALLWAGTPAVATLPCDTPLLSERVYDALRDHWQGDRPVVARSHKGLEPLIGLWPTRLHIELKKHIEQGQYSLYRFLQQIQAVQVDVPTLVPDYNPYWFWNVNVPEDLQILENHRKNSPRNC